MTKEELIVEIQKVCGLNTNIVNSLVNDLDNYTEENTRPLANLVWNLWGGEGVDEESVIEKIYEYLNGSSKDYSIAKFIAKIIMDENFNLLTTDVSKYTSLKIDGEEIIVPVEKKEIGYYYEGDATIFQTNCFAGTDLTENLCVTIGRELEEGETFVMGTLLQGNIQIMVNDLTEAIIYDEMQKAYILALPEEQKKIVKVFDKIYLGIIKPGYQVDSNNYLLSGEFANNCYCFTEISEYPIITREVNISEDTELTPDVFCNIGCKNVKLYTDPSKISDNTLLDCIYLLVSGIETRSSGLLSEAIKEGDISYKDGYYDITNLYNVMNTAGELGLPDEYLGSLIVLNNDGALIDQKIVYGYENKLEGPYFFNDNNLHTVQFETDTISESLFETSCMTELSISNKIASIGDRAFQNCFFLSSVTIPDSVTSIGEGAFYECISLTSITIPDSVTSIENNAFIYCSSLTQVTLGNSIETIGNDAFKYCCSLTSITIPDSVTSIGGGAFDECYFIDSNFINQSTCVSLDNWGACIFNDAIEENGLIYSDITALYARKNITNTEIPNNIQIIGEDAFCDCFLLTSVIIPYSVTSIGDGAFLQCYSLTSITIPDSVTSVGNYAFDQCTSLAQIILGNSVQTIGNLAFQYCSSLTSITIPNSVTSIGYSAFYNCTSLTSITCEATTPPSISNNTLPETSVVQHIYVPASSVDAYKSASGWSTYANRITAII